VLLCQLSKYCDALLRKTSRCLSEAELEEKFSEVIAVFSYLEDKDIFQRVTNLHCCTNVKKT